MDRKGDVLPLTDLVIGACALEIGAAVVSSDRHFERVAGLKLWKSLPPPGRL
jgi:predicted nucleic acid-binding protein